MKYRIPDYFTLFVLVAVMLLPGLLHAQQAHISPPWTTPPQVGKNFTIDGIDNVPDLRGDVVNPQLVVFFAGNQFMVMNDLVNAFKKVYPQYHRVFIETLPPGILEQQIEAGALVVGNMRVAVKPDVYTAGKGRIATMQKQKHWFSSTENYARNRLAIMVYKGNPKNITSLNDLASMDVRVTMPNPHWEGIAKHIEKAYVKAGGKKLLTRIMVTKVGNGSTFLTHIHHRQSPIRIMRKESDAGPVWYTEAYFQKMIGNPIDMVPIPDDQNVYVTYTAASMKSAPHPRAARDFLRFLNSEQGQKIYRKYGFLPVQNH